MRNTPTPDSVPNRHKATVAIGFVTGMLSPFVARGVDCSGFLAIAGIEPKLLEHPHERVGIDSYVALYNLLARTFDDESFGLFPAPAPVGTLEFLARSVITSRSLQDVLARGARFLRLVVPALQVTLELREDVAQLHMREPRALQATPEDPRRVFAFEWMLRLLHGLACWMVKREIALDSVAFPYARPPHAADYDLIYTPHSRFGATELVATLHANLLELPVRRDDKALEAFLAGGPGKIAALYRRDRIMVHRVRDIVARTIPAPVGLEFVARELTLSARTVHRRLHEENSSLRAIKEALRRDLALTRLEKTDLPIAQISAALGYADESTFYRAFTGWTGVSPSAYRRRLGGRALQGQP